MSIEAPAQHPLEVLNTRPDRVAMNSRSSHPRRIDLSHELLLPGSRDAHYWEASRINPNKEILYLDEKLGMKYDMPLIAKDGKSGEKDPTVAYFKGRWIMATTRWNAHGFYMASAYADKLSGTWQRSEDIKINLGNKIKPGSGLGAPTMWVDGKLYLAYQMEYQESGPIVVVETEDGEYFDRSEVVIEAIPDSHRAVSYDVSTAVLDGSLCGQTYYNERVLVFVGYAKNPVNGLPYADGRTNTYIARKIDGSWVAIETPILESESIPFLWQKGDKIKEWRGHEATELDTVPLPNQKKAIIATYVTFLASGKFRQRIGASGYDPTSQSFRSLGLLVNPERVKEQTGIEIVEGGHHTLARDPKTGLLTPDENGNIYMFFMGRSSGDDNSWCIGRASINYDRFQNYIQRCLYN